VKNNEIVLNVGFEATTALKLGNETIEFKARFGGMAREIVVPVDHVVAIYARENGQGMAFPVPTAPGAASAEAPAADAHPADGTPLRGLRLASTEADTSPPATTGPRVPPDEPPEPSGPRPSLKRIK
jgi:stringent starvation protein B